LTTIASTVSCNDQFGFPFKYSGALDLKRILISFLITIVIVFVLFTQISLEDLFTLLKNIDPLWAALGFAAYFLATLFRALRYKWLIYSRNVSLNELFRISVFYNLSLMILPSKLGELSYPYFLNKMSGVTMTEGLASLIASRVYDFFIILIVFLFASIGFQTFFKTNLFFVLSLSLFLIGLILIVFFQMNRILWLVSRIIENLSKWIRKERTKPVQWAQRKLHETAEDFHAIKAKKTYLPVALTSLISWIMVFLTFYAFVRGFRISVPFWEVVFGSTAAIITNAIPIGGFGNWGTLEVGWAVGFLMIGLPKEKAIASGFGVHILVFLVCAFFAFICWVTPSSIASGVFKGTADKERSMKGPF
jgi:uncharacterized protein (TIRG00374 family)